MPSVSDFGLHKQFQQFTESPLFAILNPESEDARKKKILPLFIYEQEQASSAGSAQPQFLRLDFSLATEDSERIAVDNVAKAADASAMQTQSVLSQNMVASLNALKLLRRKVRFLIDIVKNTPEVRSNQHFMRKL
jgi:COP9 signalosome complex subunit 6